jgi:dTDP-glucose pyrophosphorylase
MSFQPFTASRTAIPEIQPSRAQLKFMRGIVEKPSKLYISPWIGAGLYIYQNLTFDYGWVENDENGIMCLTDKGHAILEQHSR